MRGERARAKGLLFPDVFTERRSFAPVGKQVLRACGAQDDKPARVVKEREKPPSDA